MASASEWLSATAASLWVRNWSNQSGWTTFSTEPAPGNGPPASCSPQATSDSSPDRAPPPRPQLLLETPQREPG